ncbi:uncharacterized protein LOC142983209 [Anticarsia gemmatalis]|uniref:uncharacterized protein LOC142983209 n=1 Tax=Anticarsia gemmatalis TaxID=129554 RepID=UPI003F775BF1
MEDKEEFSAECLQRCSYRFLQQTAKALNLPSNVKKVYLIQLIHAKKFCSAEQVEKLVRQVRAERQHLAQARKKAKNKKKQMQQSAEISSTSNSKSPPISTTPKRVSHIMIRYSPEQYTPAKQKMYRPPNRLTQNNATINASDRVLRSFRSIKNPNYVLNNALIGIIRSSSSEESVKSVGCQATVGKDSIQRGNMKSLLKKGPWRSGNEIVPVQRPAWRSNVLPQQRQQPKIPSPKIIRRQRRLSGIYPLNEETKPPNIPNVSVRRADGTVSKLNAFIQKPLTQINNNTENSLLSICDSEKTDSVANISNNSNTSYLDAENTLNYENTHEISKENQDYTVYYHKKIRAEQVRSLRTKEMARCVENDCRLPKINDVFSKFSTVYGRDVTQPIYVQVNNEPEMVPNPPFMYPDLHNYQTTMLESLYNLKNVFVVNQPLLQIATTTNTRCVYSTPVISTAKAQPSANIPNLYNIALSQDSPQYFMDDARVHDFFRTFRCEEVLSDVTTIEVRRSSSSGESIQSQDLGANVTIPEMVEDALELISQDGDYMERMGMDVRMQCILCNWAGPKIILEYHIRKEHNNSIIQSANSICGGTFTLGSLVAARRAWISKVLEWDARLFVLSAKYEDPDYFYATLSTLSNDEDMPITGTITTYNKVTGEPFTWQGSLQQLPPTLEHDTPPYGLKLQVSNMDLIPNSANLKLLNRELVTRSPNKVVVGQPELDNVLISLIVKFYD